MERFFAFLALALAALALPTGAIAQGSSTSRTIATERWVEEWDPAAQRWVRVADSPDQVLATNEGTSVTTTQAIGGFAVEQTQTTMVAPSTARFAGTLAVNRAGVDVAQYGPFRVLDEKRAAIVGSTDHLSPAQFEAMLRDFPHLEVLEMLEAPGTRHDIANLEVGRKIRAAGLRTHVPNGGSVRSGAVELFLAGTKQTMDEGAEFAVHAWLDAYGREPKDFPADHPAHLLYLDYYVEMGMSKAQAREFYAMTNSVPHASALWLDAAQMQPWVAGERPKRPIRQRHTFAAKAQPVSIAQIGPVQFSDVALPEQIEAPTLALPVIDYADLMTFSNARADIAMLDSARAFP